MTQPKTKRLAVQQYVDDAVTGEASRATTAEGTKVNTSTYTAGQATQDAALTAHTGNTSNPHAVTKAQVGLGSADNTADSTKPVSTAQAAALALKPNFADVQATRTSGGAIVAGSHNPVDATSGNLTVTLADAASAGLMVAVSKKDATANTVTVSVAHLRDGGAGTIVLESQFEALLLVSKADGSWWPVGDHKTKAYFTATFAAKAAEARARRQYAKSYPRGATRVALPTGLGWSDTLIAGFSLLFDGAKYLTGYNAALRKNTGGTTRYFAVSGGSDTTGDGTSGLPYASLDKAHTVSSDGDTIIVKGSGIVYRGSSMNGITGSKSVNIIAETPGAVTFVCADNLTYTKTAGQTYVYQSTRTNVLRVVDIGPDPLGFRYTLVASVAACDALPGSWYQSGSTLYVHTLDNTAPTSTTIFALLVAFIFTFGLGSRTSDMNLYLEGFNVINGSRGVTATGSNAYGLDVTAKDCKFSHGDNSTADGYQMVDVRSSVCQRVVVAQPGKDGFNYHSAARTSSPTQFLEIDCEAHSCGLDRGTDYSMNASTAHDGVRGVRVNGKYHYTLGAPVADVHPNTKTAIYSTDSWDSLAPTGSGYQQAFSAQQSGAEMWLFRCRGWGTESDVYAFTGATVHVDDSTEYDTKGGGGTLDIVSVA